MKKSLWFSLFLILSCVLVFSACGTTPYTHSFDEWTITKNASCVEEGIRARYCSCGEMQTQAIPVSEHQYDNGNITTIATCIQDGVKTFTCTVAKCGHSYTEPYSLPTYTANELYNQSVKYVGEIVVYDKKGVELGLGTGFVISSDGKIVTNYHVIDGAYSADITINGVKYSIASVLAYDAKIDLAVLKINASGLTPATICKLPVSVGSTVYAIGSSRGMTNTYSQGIITYSDRVVDGVSHVQHDASITHGNSGGPLINVYGEVIGINSWMISESQNLNFAVFAGELDKLVYGTALTMAQFYELHRTANDVLTEWLLANYNAYGDWYVDYEIEGEDFIYSIAYDTEDDYNFVDGSWVFDDGAELYVCVYLDGTDGVYDYYAYYSDGVDENNTYGTINAKNYTSSTLLRCDSYDGDYWDKEELMDLYSLAVSRAMEWFTYCLENYVDEISLDDFGFETLEYEYDSSALSKLETMLKRYGTYENLSGIEGYEIQEQYHYSNYDILFNLRYCLAGEYTKKGITVSMDWQGTDGTCFYVVLRFDFPKLDKGNYFSCSYSPERYELPENQIIGYLNATTFTAATDLPYSRVVFGTESGTEALLDAYSAGFSDLMDWFDAILEEYGADFTLADLGFVFYYG